jgi:hypothetical protein
MFKAIKHSVTENDNETVCLFRLLAGATSMVILGVTVGAAAAGVWLVAEAGTAIGAVLAGAAAGVWGKGKR